MNTLNNDSQDSTHTSLVSPKDTALSRALGSSAPRTRVLFLVIIFVLGLSSGVLLSQFQRADGTFSAQAGIDVFSGKAREADLDDATISAVWEHIHDAFVNQPVDDKKMMYGAISGMVAGLNDPYSVYFNPDDAAQFLSEIHGEFSGIGAEIDSKDSRIVVVAPLPNSPAESAGVQAGDHILTVDDADVTGMTVSEVVSRIRGEKGTTVHILVERQGSATPLEFSIVRDTIQIQSVKWSWLPDTKIAHIEVSSFSDDTVQLFTEAIGQIVVDQPTGIIVDMRNNPGGYLEAAVQLSAQFLDKGSVVLYEQHADGTEKVYTTETQPTIGSLPVVVLVNGGSASAAEIFTGALKDSDRATVIGETTFGKGSVQDVKKFDDGSLLKLTIAHWLTPHKTVIQDHGVVPEYVIEMTSEDYAQDRDPQLDAARLFLTDTAAFGAMHAQQSE